MCLRACALPFMLVIFLTCSLSFEYNLFYLQFEIHNELPLKNEHPPMETQPDLAHLLKFEKDN